MKAISLWEPWGTAMALNLKENETRDWPVSYRGELAICSAKRKMTALEEGIFEEFIRPDFPDAQVEYGKVLCVVTLYACVRGGEFEQFGDGQRTLSYLESSLGNYHPSRFAWMTRNCRRLKEPVPVVGRQGLFELPAEVEEKVRAQIERCAQCGKLGSECCAQE